MKFNELDLCSNIQKGINEAGYITCMPVQENVFKHSFKGKDIYAQSQTGTGKTAAYLISIFQRILTDSESKNRKVLILAPTRELAIQIETEAKKLGKYLDLSIGSFFGGVGYEKQLKMLGKNVQFIIGTPGRIIDLVQQGKMILRDVGFLVIDEADRMFDMGFIDDLRKLLKFLSSSENRQTFLFSATLNFRVKNLSWEYMSSPIEITIEPEQVTVELISQELYHVGIDEKFSILLGLFSKEKPGSSIIFCNQKNITEEVARKLKINDIDCEFIMGDLPQYKRTDVINRMKSGLLKVLVATDVAARGLDIDSLDLVVNYDIPVDPESYVHRIGRTARAGKTGKAISLACEKFVYGLPAIEKFINGKIPVFPVTDELLLHDKSAGMHFGKPMNRSRSIHNNNRKNKHGTDSLRTNRSNNYKTAKKGNAQLNQSGHAPLVAAISADISSNSNNLRKKTNQTIHKNKIPNPYSMTSEERMDFYKRKYKPEALLTIDQGTIKKHKKNEKKTMNNISSVKTEKTKSGFFKKILNLFGKENR